MLGRLLPDYFPKIFGASEKEGLDIEASRAALEILAKGINAETGGSMSVDEVAWGSALPPPLYVRALIPTNADSSKWRTRPCLARFGA